MIRDGARVWLEALLRCRVALAVLASLAAGLIALPQMTDLLITLGQSGSVAHWAGFAVATVWLAASARLWSRFALFRGERVQVGLAGDVIPDALAAIAFAVVGGALWHAADGVPEAMRAADAMASGPGGLRIAAWLALAAAVTAFALGRVFPVMASIGRGTTLAIAGLAACVGLAGLLAFGADPVAAAGVVTPEAIVLFAAAGLIAGGTLLLEAARRTGVPVLPLAFAVAVTLAALRDRDVIADNHDVRRLAGPVAARPSLEAAYAAFLDATGPAYGDAPVPVVLVATSGGGIAAAYWTATVLGDLADASPEFARQVFAISGVSGGGLGATAYVAGAREACPEGRKRCLQAALSGDFLGPVLGALLYPDLLQRFVPKILVADRQAALEGAWEARWFKVFGDARLGGPFLDLWEPGKPWPVLLLNATAYASGGRAVASDVVLDERTGAPVLDVVAALGAGMRASTAAGNGARFPYLSPIGTVRDAAGRRTDGVGDGGYFENLGATTLLDVLDALEHAPRGGRAVRFVVIQVVTDPDIGPDGAVDPGGGEAWLPEGLAGPATMLLRTRTARGAQASAVLARRVAGLGGQYVPVRLGQSPTGGTAPLSWSLSGFARGVIDARWTDACRARLLALSGFSGAAPGMGAMAVGEMWRAAACGAAVLGAAP